MKPIESLERRSPAESTANERGAALLLALIVLTTLTVVALFLGSSAAVNRRIAGADVTKSKALRYAEAGLAEALARIQKGQGPSPYVTNAPRKVVQIVLASTGSAVGADTTLLPTGQPTGAWLPYSVSGRSNRALTIEFRTNPARTQIYRYDKSLSPPIQTSSGAPIFRITSTGWAGDASRTIVAEVGWNPVNISNIKGALCAGQDVKFTGNAVACGYNHRADTPTWTGKDTHTGAGGCAENLGITPPLWEWNSGTLAGIWTAGNGSESGAANAYGTPPISNYQSPFYAGPWEILGMSQAQFYDWVGPPIASLPGTPNGVYHLDNDATKQNSSGNFDLVTGQGFLYCDGDLTLHANWRGVIYVEGSMTLNSDSWILGAVIVKGGNIDFNGGATILYSYDSIQQNVGNLLTWGKPYMISWREI